MAFQGTQMKIPGLTAAADLSTKQFHFVKMVGDTSVNVCTAVTDVPVGVLQNKPTLGQAAEVAYFGPSKVVADALLAAGNLIGTSADSQAQPLTVGTEITVYIAGQVIQGAAADAIATALINCANPARAA